MIVFANPSVNEREIAELLHTSVSVVGDGLELRGPFPLADRIILTAHVGVEEAEPGVTQLIVRMSKRLGFHHRANGFKELLGFPVVALR